MATDLNTTSDASATALVSGIINDAQDLMRQQFELLKHEVRADVGKTADVILAFAAGACVGFAALFMAALTAAYLLQWAVPGLPLWACFGIPGLVLAVASAGLCVVGKLKLQSFRAAPSESVQALKENVQWITNPK